uniref:Uncharacterized protein n=1 Tax=Globodera rostochiensis TaxID=31243 RepID=A0A914H3B5_GLORO
MSPISDCSREDSSTGTGIRVRGRGFGYWDGDSGTGTGIWVRGRGFGYWDGDSGTGTGIWVRGRGFGYGDGDSGTGTGIRVRGRGFGYGDGDLGCMLKLLFCCTVLIVFSDASLDDPVEVKYLADLLLDFSANYCGDLSSFTNCFSAKPQLLETFYSEVNRRKMELEKKSFGAKMFDNLNKFLARTVRSEDPKLIGKAIGHFAANVFKAFVHKARYLLENSSRDKMLLETRRELNENEFYKYELLAATFDELANSVPGNFDVASAPQDFLWQLQSDAARKLGKLKLDELENPLEIKLLAELMYNFGTYVCGDILEIAKCFEINPFVSESFQENLKEKNEERAQLVSQRSFFDQMDKIAVEHLQANPQLFGLAICKFIAKALDTFLENAKGIFNGSKMGKALLESRGLDENAMLEYEYLAKVFSSQAGEFHSEMGRNENIGNLHQSINRNARFLWKVDDTFNTKLTLKLEILNSKILVNSSQIKELISKIPPTSDKPDQQQKNLLFDFGTDSESVTKSKNLILCDALYAFGALVIQKAAKIDTNSSYVANLLDDTNSIPFTLELAKKFETSANHFGLLITKKLKKHSINIIKIHLEALVFKTEVVLFD